MARTFTYPPKPQRGDAVAVLSPSWGGPGAFPLPFELGLARLRDEFGLRPVEYPTTRAAQASPAERAKDLHSAFADPEIKAVLTSIGGEDEIKVLRHLDPEVLAANPKPFFGYSDNTNLHLFLWNLKTTVTSAASASAPAAAQTASYWVFRASTMAGNWVTSGRSPG